MNLFPFLKRLPRLRPSLPLINLTSSFYRLLSTAATTRSSPPNPHFVAVDYLIQSYGLPSDEALRASKRIQHLKSPGKPDVVLRFLRQIGISESDIRTAVSRDSRLLCSHVEKNMRPNVAKLQEIGLSIEDISGIISRSPELFLFNIVQKIDFWMRFLGSLENMSVLLKKGPVILNYNLEKVIVPNLSFLQKQCGFSVCQIVQLIKSGRLIGLRPETMKVMVKRAEELGFSCSSRMFVYALRTVFSVNKNIINSRVHYLKSMGLSQEKVTYVISKAPMVLTISRESLGRKMKFLKSMGFSQEEVTYMIIRAPSLLQITAELLGRKIEFLKSMGFSQEDVTCVIRKMPTVLQLSEELLGRKIEFLIKDAGCGKIDVVRNPIMLTFQLEKRLIPRSVVRKLLMSEGLPVAIKAFATFARPSDEKFVEKFVLPYELDIPGLGQAYKNASVGKTGAIE